MRKKKSIPPNRAGFFNYIFAVKLLLLIPLCSFLAAAVIDTVVQALSEQLQNDTPSDIITTVDEAQKPSDSIIQADVDAASDVSVIPASSNGADTFSEQKENEAGTEGTRSGSTDTAASEQNEKAFSKCIFGEHSMKVEDNIFLGIIKKRLI